MAKLNSRGHEVVSSTPFEPSVYLNRAPRESLLEQIQRMVQREQMAQADVIRDEADLMEDQLDFEDTYDADGLIMPSPYEVADEVPDGFSAAEYRNKKTDSPNVPGSDLEPAHVAGE